jgi:hypothetical protein
MHAKGALNRNKGLAMKSEAIETKDLRLVLYLILTLYILLPTLQG